MTKSFTGRKRIRKEFGRIRAVAPMPNLIEVQKSSYDSFLQIHDAHEDRIDHGLQEVFKSVFPSYSWNTIRVFVGGESDSSASRARRVDAGDGPVDDASAVTPGPRWLRDGV